MISKKSEWEAFLTETYVLDTSVGGDQPSTSSLNISETDDGLVQASHVDFPRLKILLQNIMVSSSISLIFLFNLSVEIMYNNR